jgi:hypothetical protein
LKAKNERVKTDSKRGKIREKFFWWVGGLVERNGKNGCKKSENGLDVGLILLTTPPHSPHAITHHA